MRACRIGLAERELRLPVLTTPFPIPIPRISSASTAPTRGWQRGASILSSTTQATSRTTRISVQQKRPAVLLATLPASGSPTFAKASGQTRLPSWSSGNSERENDDGCGQRRSEFHLRRCLRLYSSRDSSAIYGIFRRYLPIS